VGETPISQRGAYASLWREGRENRGNGRKRLIRHRGDENEASKKQQRKRKKKRTTVRTRSAETGVLKLRRLKRSPEGTSTTSFAKKDRIQSQRDATTTYEAEIKIYMSQADRDRTKKRWCARKGSVKAEGREGKASIASRRHEELKIWGQGAGSWRKKKKQGLNRTPARSPSKGRREICRGARCLRKRGSSDPHSQKRWLRVVRGKVGRVFDMCTRSKRGPHFLYTSKGRTIGEESVVQKNLKEGKPGNRIKKVRKKRKQSPGWISIVSEKGESQGQERYPLKPLRHYARKEP